MPLVLGHGQADCFCDDVLDAELPVVPELVRNLQGDKAFGGVLASRGSVALPLLGPLGSKGANLSPCGCQVGLRFEKGLLRLGDCLLGSLQLQLGRFKSLLRVLLSFELLGLAVLRC